MSGRRSVFLRAVTGVAAATLLACGSSPPPKPAVEAPVGPPKIEKVAGIPDGAVKAFNAGVTALEQSPPDYAGASGHFESATTAYPAYDAAWLNLAFCYGKSGRYADAVGAYRKVIAKGNVPKAVQLDFGRALMISGELENAITEFESVLRAEPESLGARNNLSAAYQRKGDFETALKYVKEVLAVQPKNVPAIINLGLIYLKQNKLPLAVLMFKKATGYDAKNAFAANNLGLAYYALNDIPGSVIEFEKAISFDPTMDEARLNLASIYLDYLDYAAALPQFQAVRARFPKNYPAMVGEANSLYGTQQFEQAAKVFEESLAVKANNPEVLLRVGKIYEEQLNQPKTALGYYVKYRDVVKPGPNDPINATIQFLEQADTMKPQEKPPEAPAPASEGAPAPASDAAPASAAAPASEAAPASAAPAPGSDAPK